jgi:Na+-driven multidrug efflux pump
VFNVSIIPGIAFSSAISAMVAQNTGAGQYSRSRQCLKVGMRSALSFRC